MNACFMNPSDLLSLRSSRSMTPEISTINYLLICWFFVVIVFPSTLQSKSSFFFLNCMRECEGELKTQVRTFLFGQMFLMGE